MSEVKKIDLNETGLEIAIIGMAARFPGASSIEEFWKSLLEGKESVRFFTAEDLRSAGVSDDLLRDPAYVPAAAIVEGIDIFDASLFNYTHREAEMMDPQTRIFHQCSWEALEDAGYNSYATRLIIGCYVGASSHFDWEAVSVLSGLRDIVGDFAAGHLVDKDYLATRLAFKLNLRGPAVTLHSACSTSLVAVHMACQGLLSGDCDMALAGGVTISIGQKKGYLFREGMIASPDGHCRAFDKEAAGTVFGYGAGVVLLKRLEDAREELDHIYAVIKGSSINNDGSEKAGYTAPSIEGQASVIRNAMRMAEVESESIGYVEAHGTGTNLGDPVEIEGLTLAFDTELTGFCGIGSVKTNIGHLDIAAGIAGLIKTALAIYHRRIPPSLHFNEPNPNLNLADTPFYVVQEVCDWKRGSTPLRAGISSFGIGGTNAHVILEEVSGDDVEKPIDSRDSKTKQELLLLSAATPDALEQIIQNLAEHLDANSELDMADISYTLKVGRKPLEFRAVLRNAADRSGMITGRVEEENPQVIFMFPGQGAQYRNMARDLYKEQPVFRDHLDECFQEFRQWTDVDLKSILYPQTSFEESGDSDPINQTAVTQPLIFAVEYAMARLLMSLGIEPTAMIGHSIGEYTAACLAGIMTLSDTCRLVVARGKGMQEMEGGAMLSVPLPEEAVLGMLPDSVSLAAVNSPTNCVVSGPYDVIDSFCALMEARELPYRRLHTSHAFHSDMMEPMVGAFVRHIEATDFNRPSIPVISNVTASPIEATPPEYWGRQVRETVRFSDGIKWLVSQYSNPVFIEVGPGKTLNTFVRNYNWQGDPPGILHTIRHPNENVLDDDYLGQQLGQMWLYGVPIDWANTYVDSKRRRVSLPTYPFQPTKFPVPSVSASINLSADTRKEWFYTPVWKPIPLSGEVTIEGDESLCLIVGEEGGLAADIGEEMSKQHNVRCVYARPADKFRPLAEDSFEINIDHKEDFDLLFKDLSNKNRVPSRIIFTNWVTADSSSGIFTLFYLAQVIGEMGVENNIEIFIITSNLLEVGGSLMFAPRRAALLGPIHIMPLEYPGLNCKLIDIDRGPDGSDLSPWLLHQLANEILNNVEDDLIVYRGKQRMKRTFEALSLPNQEIPASILKKNGVYLLTGGLGGIGLEMAGYLAEAVSARLILLGRSDFPVAEEWDEWLQSHGAGDPISRKIKKLRAMLEKGSSILVLKGDVANETDMRTVRDTIQRKFGSLNGIIHAAGVPGGGVIQLKTREMAEAILKPKIEGALVLDSIFEKDNPDFFVMCSSINSVVPMAGQADYTGANAFLDIYSSFRNQQSSTLYMSVNWDPWTEVGMAADAAKEPGPHPLLEYRLKNAGSSVVYTSYFSLDRYWALAEHMVEGQGVMTGTTYIEMARAAATQFLGEDQSLEVRHVNFLFPLIVGPSIEREAKLILTPQGEGFEFKVESKITDDTWQTHARGELYIVPTERKNASTNLDEAKERCLENYSDPHSKDGSGQMGILTLGARWRSRDWMRYGENEGVARLELPHEHISDLDLYHFHPALMDLATAFLYNRFSEGNGYMPFSYDRISIKKTLSPVIYSHCKLAKPLSGDREFLTFDLTIYNEAGEELVDIAGFTMIRFSEQVKDRINKEEMTATSIIGESEGSHGTRIYGIKPSEGVVIFSRLLTGGLTRIAISIDDLDKRLHPPANEKDEQDSQSTSTSGSFQARPGLSNPFVEPEPGLESQIAGIWSKLLGFESIGAEDDFFELGGDSLKAITASGQLHKQTGIQVPLSEFFNRPNVRKLAQFFKGSEDTALASIPKAEIKGFYPLSPAQKKLYIIHYLEPDGISLNLPNGFIIDGPLEVRKVQTVFEALIRRHEALRTSFATVNGVLMQKIHDEVEFELEYLEAPECEAEAVGNRFVRPFHLDRAPMIRAGMVKLSDNRHLLLIDVHHIVYDRVSKAILYREFQQMLAGETLPPLTVNYRDYSQWQSDGLDSPEMKRQEDYWLDLFKGEIQPLQLPTDFPRPPRQTFDAGHIEFEIGNDETKRLKNMASSEGATLQMLMIAIFNILLAKLSGQEDITVGTPIAGRFHPDLEGIVGVFINSLALRNFPSNFKTFREFFHEVKENSLQAYQNQGFQFEDLVERLGIARDQGRNPLYDVMFEIQKEMVEEVVSDKEENDKKIKPLALSDDKVLFDMDWVGLDFPEGILFHVKYNKRLFEFNTMQLFTRYFQILISQVLENPDLSIGELDHRTPEEIKLNTYQDVEFDF